ncbi:sugar O-acetyltransferase [Arcanobacterium haemolyticum]|nr:sugar O-acetyltransferase [Arcanobacterium haemolyticum]
MTTELHNLLDHLDRGEELDPATPLGITMSEYSARARDVCALINAESSNAERIRELFASLIGEDVPETFRLFPPFTSDFGRNIHIGDDVFINSGCQFQDQGGIYIDDGALIGHSVIIATLNHEFDPDRRGVLLPKPVRIGACAWIGAGAIILPGVTIGDGAVVGAGSVVSRDVAPRTVVAGNPARKIREI